MCSGVRGDAGGGEAGSCKAGGGEAGGGEAGGGEAGGGEVPEFISGLVWPIVTCYSILIYIASVYSYKFLTLQCNL